jgi:hypothetical protein
MYKITEEQRQQCLSWLHAQVGDDYVFGVENDSVAEPSQHDCSELVQIAFSRFLGLPKFPDGARYQYSECTLRGRIVPFPLAKVEPLDLVFLWDRGLKTIDHVGVVAFTEPETGEVYIIEARGLPYRKVIAYPLNRFLVDFGNRVAGVYRIITIDK